MKTISVLAGMLLAPAVLSAAAFEGRVAFKMSSERGQSQEMRYAIKSGKIRLEMMGGRSAGGAMIIDPVKRETIMIRDQERMYMTMAMPDEPPAAKGRAGDDVNVRKTGETERILGYTAEKYLTTNDGATTELWLAEGLGTFIGPGAVSGGGPMGGRRGSAPAAAQAWEKALAGKELFPLRVVTRDSGGKETFRMEVTDIQKQALPDGLFAPPADYQKFDMGAMMQGAMPGMMRKKG